MLISDPACIRFMSHNGPRRERPHKTGDSDSGSDSPDDGDDRPLIPEGVYDGINDIAHGNTAAVDDIEEILKE